MKDILERLREQGYQVDFDAVAEIEQLRAALVRSQQALNDWMVTYASDNFDEKSVAEAQSRISEYGTLAYIVYVQEQNSAALKLK